MVKTFPFSEASKIELISYPVRYEWDTINVNGDTRINSLVKDKKLIINPKKVEQRIILNNELIKKLFNFLFIEECPTDHSQAACFDPRHSIIFYNKRNEVIAYSEICLGCSTSESSAGFEYNQLCIERMANLRIIFREAGMKIDIEDEF